MGIRIFCYRHNMISVEGMTKHFGGKLALDQVSFHAENGKVTGFLGPNGAGKSTTMRAILGLIKPESGSSTIDGKPYRQIKSPMTSVGAVLDAKSIHKGRSAYAHLLSLAMTNKIPTSRVDEVVNLTGLNAVKEQKAGSYSLGMSQRLSIASALLGDPQNLILDEPINGLDPEGVKWVREVCRFCASQGKAVLLSSHLMSEVALTADNLVIIGKGRILRATTVSDFVDMYSANAIRVATTEPERLSSLFLHIPQVQIQQVAHRADDPRSGTVFRILGAELEQVAQLLSQSPLMVLELVEEHTSLEDAYMALTHDQVQYSSSDKPSQGPHGQLVAESARRVVEIPVETSMEKPVETSMEKPVETSMEKPVETSMEKPMRTSMETSATVSIGESMEMSNETAMERPVRRSARRFAERSAKHSVERTAEQSQAAKRTTPRKTVSHPITSMDTDSHTARTPTNDWATGRATRSGSGKK